MSKCSKAEAGVEYRSNSMNMFPDCGLDLPDGFLLNGYSVSVDLLVGELRGITRKGEKDYGLNGFYTVVRSPYNPELIPKLKALGARWMPDWKAWRAHLSVHDQVCALVRTVAAAKS